MSDDVTNVLLKKVDELQEISAKTAIEVAVISAKLEEREKRDKEKDHEKRICALEQKENQLSGSKAVLLGILGILPLVFSIISLFKH
jgi:ribosome-binding ATPase YchF (GTP1/OBG family)